MTVRVERGGAVWTVTIDRPERRNAVDPATAQALRDAFDAFDADEEAAAAVLTGAGGCFCAGYDLKAFAAEGAGYDPDGEGPGIITERDVLRAVAAGVDPETAVVGDHHVDELTVAHPDWSLEQAATSNLRIFPFGVGDDVDTDQIIPARFLKTTSKVGLGKVLFNDWRQDPAFVLNRPDMQDAQVLLAGDNFGCGSSREHAPWALTDFGFRAVISTSFADIFRGNALKNGLLPIIVDQATHDRLMSAAQAGPIEVTINLAAQCLVTPSGEEVDFPIDAFAKRCLLAGTDQLGYLMSHAERIAAFEEGR